MGDEEEVGLYIIDQERELCSKHITLLATIVLSMNLHTNRGQFPRSSTDHLALKAQ